jgi:hypothetical protein
MFDEGRSNSRLPVSRPVGRILGFAMLLGLFALGQPESAFAQAGSIGGTIGKQDKSISGVEETPASHSPAKTKRKFNQSSETNPATGSGKGCGRIIGVWTWRSSIFSWRIVVRPNGVATHSIDNGISGTWSCKDDNAVFVWANGKYLDHVILLPEPDRLEGTNKDGIKFTGMREAN